MASYDDSYSGPPWSGDGWRTVVPNEEEFAALLAEARGGSKEALFEAVERALPFVSLPARHLLWRAVRCRGDAEDTQCLHLAALTHFDRFRAGTFTQFAAWLATMLANQKIDSFRRACALKRGGGRVENLGDRDLRDPLLDRDGADPVVSAAMKREDLDRLHRALADLPQRERTIVEMHYFQGLSFKAIGQALHESADAVRMACRRTLRKLRRTLGEDRPRRTTKRRTGHRNGPWS